MKSKKTEEEDEDDRDEDGATKGEGAPTTLVRAVGTWHRTTPLLLTCVVPGGCCAATQRPKVDSRLRGGRLAVSCRTGNCWSRLAVPSVRRRIRCRPGCGKGRLTKAPEYEGEYL